MQLNIIECCVNPKHKQVNRKLKQDDTEFSFWPRMFLIYCFLENKNLFYPCLISALKYLLR